MKDGPIDLGYYDGEKMLGRKKDRLVDKWQDLGKPFPKGAHPHHFPMEIVACTNTISLDFIELEIERAALDALEREEARLCAVERMKGALHG